MPMRPQSSNGILDAILTLFLQKLWGSQAYLVGCICAEDSRWEALGLRPFSGDGEPGGISRHC